MKRIFLIQAEAFAAGMVPEFRRHGIEVVLATTLGPGSPEAFERVLSPSAIHLKPHEAWSGMWPKPLASRIRPPTPADVTRLAPTAAATLEMLDRQNLDDQPVQELKRLYYDMIGAWRTFLDDLRPDAVVFCVGVPHFGFDNVVYELCHADGTPTIMFMHTHIDQHVLVVKDIHDIPGPTPAELMAMDAVPDDRVLFTSKTHEALYAEANNLRTIRRRLSALGVLRPLVGRRMWGRHPAKPWFLYDPTPPHLVVRWRNFKGRVQARRCIMAYDRLAQPPVWGSPFVYYPLHVQPEDGTNPLGGPISDQLMVLHGLSAALPTGWKILVKEHPNQFNRRFLMAHGRDVAFYERLTAIPNVQPVPLATRAQDLVHHAAAVATMSGTTGWEALLAGKPALVFGTPWYLRAPGVLRVSDTASCAQALLQVARGEATVSPDLIRRYIRCMRERYMARLVFVEELLPYSKMTPEEHVTAFVTATRRALGWDQGNGAPVTRDPHYSRTGTHLA